MNIFCVQKCLCIFGQIGSKQLMRSAGSRNGFVRNFPRKFSSASGRTTEYRRNGAQHPWNLTRLPRALPRSGPGNHRTIAQAKLARRASAQNRGAAHPKLRLGRKSTFVWPELWISLPHSADANARSDCQAKKRCTRFSPGLVNHNYRDCRSFTASNWPCIAPKYCCPVVCTLK